MRLLYWALPRGRSRPSIRSTARRSPKLPSLGWLDGQHRLSASTHPLTTSWCEVPAGQSTRTLPSRIRQGRRCHRSRRLLSRETYHSYPLCIQRCREVPTSPWAIQLRSRCRIRHRLDLRLQLRQVGAMGCREERPQVPPRQQRPLLQPTLQQWERPLHWSQEEGVMEATMTKNTSVASVEI